MGTIDTPENFLKQEEHLIGFHHRAAFLKEDLLAQTRFTANKSLSEADKIKMKNVSYANDSNNVLTVKFKVAEIALTNHLKTVRCTDNFYHLMRDASYDVIDWMEQSGQLQPIKSWDNCPHYRAQLAGVLSTEFHNAVSRRTGHEFEIPPIQFRVPDAQQADNEAEDLLADSYGLFYDYPTFAVHLNALEAFTSGHVLQYANTAIHESVHSMHAQLAKHMRDDTLPEVLKPYMYDATIWDLFNEFNFYVRSTTSLEGYHAQPIEDIALTTGVNFQKVLEQRLKTNDIDLPTSLNEATNDVSKPPLIARVITFAKQPAVARIFSSNKP